MSIVHIKKNSEFSQVSKFYKKINSAWVEMTQADALSYIEGGVVSVFNPYVVPDRFEIGAPRTLTGETCQCLAILNGTEITGGVTWYVTSGNTRASINTSTGVLTVASSATKSDITIRAVCGTNIADHTMTVTYLSGTTSETTTQTVVDASGNSTTITVTVTENEDGTTCSESTTVTYSPEGEPLEKTNESVDTGGNVSTQEIAYDESGQEVVVGYTIDTTDNPDGVKNFNKDGVNTEYYAFDLTAGLVIDFNFTIDFSNQPANQDSNHHNILTMKRVSPEPWYGFQIRQIPETPRCLQLGVQFETGSNIYTPICANTITNNVAEYNLRIAYDPRRLFNKFVCYDVINDTNVFVGEGSFPDIEALKYLKVVLGCALNTSGQPFRYSNINVKNFSIKKLFGAEVPIIECNGSEIELTCPTAGASVYYRLNQSGNFVQYVNAIEITANTTVEAYSLLGEYTSDTATGTCVYHDYSQEYLTFDILDTGTIGWRRKSSGSISKTIEYSLNNGAWTSIDASASTEISVSQGDKVRFRGTNDAYAVSNNNYCGFGNIGTSTYDVYGNIMSLVYGDSFTGQTTLPSSCTFCCMFDGSKAVSAENLVLPATALTADCYRALFSNTSTLVKGPKLPALQLAERCYYAMFGCTSITRAPRLPARTLPNECYRIMFQTCSTLSFVECLATNVGTNSVYRWLSYVSPNGTFVKYRGSDWTTYSDMQNVHGIPRGWSVVEVGLYKPEVSCVLNNVSISTQDVGATIYYRVNQTGDYQQYTSPFTITSDTVVQAYSVLSGDTSVTTTQLCEGMSVEEPVISCDGQYVTISCATESAETYYRLNQSGSYSAYTSPIEITSTTIVEAYATVDIFTSTTASATCVYDVTIPPPEITCDGGLVTITSSVLGGTAYYRFDQQGSFSQYVSPVAITADTLVEAYSVRGASTSITVSELCEYGHDYTKDYLTFNVILGGTIQWQSFGSGFGLAIEYSINNGAWTQIVATNSASPTTFLVETNDAVRFRGNNPTYAGSKSAYAGFEGGTAYFNVEGNIMSLISGDSFSAATSFTGTHNFCSTFKKSHVVSAENLILPVMNLTNYAYRALFSWCTDLVKAPVLPATTLGQGCYWYMFEKCAITSAPELPATTLVKECYGHMFEGCSSLSYVKCMASSALNVGSATTNWLISASTTGIFVKSSGTTYGGNVQNTNWSRGQGGIPNGWTIYDEEALFPPDISFDGDDEVEITCDTSGATIYYRLNQTGIFSAYTSAITITATTTVEACSEKNGATSATVTETCEFVSLIPLEASNRDLTNWKYNNQVITTPYSVNAIDGHSSSYSKGTFIFETNVTMRSAQPTYLWFQHADQSAMIYVDDTLVEKHWGGYNSFFTDISNYVHSGKNNIKVYLCNNEGNNLAPSSADFNFNATLGNVKLFTSPVLPATIYGYDGFHITSTVSDSSATITVKTSIPTGATVVCSISDDTFNYSDTSASTGNEMSFTATISNPHLWNGTTDPHLYTVTLEIYYQGSLYHRFQRPYGLRYYSYVINDTNVLPNNEPYTGFLLNGSPYLLRGVCMHDDIANKANALNTADYTQEFAIIQELGCNFIRLAHYPHPKEVYDWCDQLGIIVETEVPLVNVIKSTHPSDYYTHLEGQYTDMVNQHYNHPCIVFWCLGNEFNAQMDDSSFAKTKLEGYRDIIKSYDTERLVGYVLNNGSSNPKSTMGGADMDWYGCNMYVGWYNNTSSNNPTSGLNTRVNNIITNNSRALAYSEYGAGGTQNCHSDDFMSTTTRGNNARHDIEYQMWLHEGHIAAIRNFPQLIFTSMWQLFDIAVASRNEGYTECFDGLNSSTNDDLRRLNNKGLVERDHVTKKDTFYLYKAEWSSQMFVHICGKDYTKITDRVIKCYTNDEKNGELSMSVNGTPVETVTVTNHIATFTARNFSSGDVITVSGNSTNDTLTIT